MKLPRFTFWLLACIAIILMVGWPLMWMKPVTMNQDSFMYLSVANHYLYDTTRELRDAYTVGPVIPLILAGTKAVILYFVDWHPDVDIAILKAFTLLAYGVIAVGMFRLTLPSTTGLKAALAVIASLAFLVIGPDAFSLNGELVAVALLILLMLELRSPRSDKLADFKVLLLCVLIIYTKIQAIPLLALTLVSHASERDDKWSFVFRLALGVILVEMVLFFAGVGVLKNSLNMLNYILIGNSQETLQSSGSFSIGVQFRRWAAQIAWLKKEWGANFPFVFFVLFALVVSPSKKIRTFGFSHWLVWLGVTVITIIASGFQFPHYVNFTWVFLARFTGPALEGLDRPNSPDRASKWLIGGAIAALVVLRMFNSGANFHANTGNSSPWFPRFYISDEVQEVARHLDNQPGRIFVHGWDYSVYAYLNTYSSGHELPLVVVGALSPKQYLDSIESEKRRYLLDVINHTGYVSNLNFSLDGSNVYAEYVRQNFKLVYEKNRLRLYERKQ